MQDLKYILVGLIGAAFLGAGLWLAMTKQIKTHVYTPEFAQKQPFLGVQTPETASSLGAVEFKEIELNGKLLKNKAEYAVEKQKVLNEMKKLGKEKIDLNKLFALQDDWKKIVEREKCKVNGSDLRLPEDSQKYLDLSIAAIENC